MRSSIASANQAFRAPQPLRSVVARSRHALAIGLAVAALLAAGNAGAQQQSDPRQASTILEQARRLIKEGKPDNALKALDDGLKVAPRDAQLRFLYGVTLNERGRAPEAIDVFQQMTEDFPELPEPYNNLAVLYAAKGDLDKARSALENAVRALPGYALALENLGDVYVRMAARSYEQAGAADKTSESSKSKLAMARDLLNRIAPPVAAKPAAAGTGKAN